MSSTYEIPVLGKPTRRAMPHTTLSRYAEICALVFKQPRTISDLRAAMGGSYDGFQRVIDTLHAEGLVYICAWRCFASGRPAPVFAWQPSCCELPDAPKPALSARAARRAARQGVAA